MTAGTHLFGDQLRRLRRAAGLTQELLAERSGISLKAIAALENGRRRRPHRATLDMLADGLALTPEERQGLAAIARGIRPAAEIETGAEPPAPWVGVPPDPDPHFVGREAELAELSELLQRHRSAAVDGLGGVGKTQLVVHYLHRHRADYPDGAFWLRADQEASLAGDLAGLTWRLRLPSVRSAGRSARSRRRYGGCGSTRAGCWCWTMWSPRSTTRCGAGFLPACPGTWC